MNRSGWLQYDVIYRQPALTGLIAQIRGGWTQPERDRWLEAFVQVLNFVAPVTEADRGAALEGDEG